VIRLVAQDKPPIIVADGQDIGSLDAGQFVESAQEPFAGSRRRHAQLSISRRASTRALERVLPHGLTRQHIEARAEFQASALDHAQSWLQLHS